MANIASLEVILTLPSIDQPTSAGSSRPLKQTYAVAGQQNGSKYPEKTDCHLDLTDSSTIPRATKWTKFSKLNRMRKPGLLEAEFQRWLDSIKTAASNTSDDLGRCCTKYKQWVVGDERRL